MCDNHETSNNASGDPEKRHSMMAWSNGNIFRVTGLCAVTGEFPSQGAVTRNFDVFFDLRLNKRLSKQSRGWWFETPSRPLWRQCNDRHDFAYVDRVKPVDIQVV